MAEVPSRLEVREYGSAGPRVVLLHGGPGAPGCMAPLARALAGRFRVLEPLQRASGGEPLTVASHVADLDGLLAERCGHGAIGGEPFALVGSSWGAMLALAWAAAHPEPPVPLVLVGCGTFDRDSRARLRAVVEERTTPELRARVARLEREIEDPAERFAAWARALFPLYSHELVDEPDETLHYDERANRETWEDMVRLQDEGLYPRAFAAIEAPVVMLHGAQDPHPGGMIRAGLAPHLPQLEYREWRRCGHFPWLERHAREEFLAVLGSWLARRLAV